MNTFSESRGGVVSPFPPEIFRTTHKFFEKETAPLSPDDVQIRIVELFRSQEWEGQIEN